MLWLLLDTLLVWPSWNLLLIGCSVTPSSWTAPWYKCNNFPQIQNTSFVSHAQRTSCWAKMSFSAPSILAFAACVIIAIAKPGSVCTQAPYSVILPFSNYAPAEAFCSSHYPVKPVIRTTTTTPVTTVYVWITHLVEKLSAPLTCSPVLYKQRSSARRRQSPSSGRAALPSSAIVEAISLAPPARALRSLSRRQSVPQNLILVLILTGSPL